MPEAEQRLPRVTARATAGGLRAISGGSRSTHSERDRSRLGGSVTLTLGTAADDRPRRSGSFLRRSIARTRRGNGLADERASGNSDERADLFAADLNSATVAEASDDPLP